MTKQEMARVIVSALYGGQPIAPDHPAIEPLVRGNTTEELTRQYWQAKHDLGEDDDQG